MKLLLVTLLLCCIAACSTTSRYYDWGTYDDDLYRYPQHADEHDAIRTRLVKHLINLEKQGALVPPGLYAEAGSYYLENGDVATAVVYYQKEYDAWPESRTLMGALIENLGKHSEAKSP